MLLDKRACDRARRSRDARFDGRFFIAVTTTRVYCRPICPARAPKDAHVRYFATAAAAEAAGFRPCLRCRPEASPGTPAWFGTSSVVSRALRLIAEGALDDVSVDALADRLGVTSRHLRRLFLQHLGATPRDVALTRRVHFAKKLLDETSLPLNEVAFAAGFGSVRRFNGQIRRTYKRTPSELRRLARHVPAVEPECYRFRLAYRPPYDWEAVLSFLRARATPGVEIVDGSSYRRTIAVEGEPGVIGVCHHDSGTALNVEVRFPNPRALLSIVERVRRLFDLGADPAVIAGHLRADPLLEGPLLQHPGIRTPGAWDGFELAVRAIVGQQISVRGATTLAGRLASLWGSDVDGGTGLVRLFPTPAQLMDAEVERAGVMPARAETIRSLARRVLNGGIVLDARADVRVTVAALQALPGIGAWTAEYIAMRALGEPDAFSTGDLVLRRMTGDLSARALDRRSAARRPWRAYAVMLLWEAATREGESWRMTHAPSVEDAANGRSRNRRTARLAVPDRTDRPRGRVAAR
jgi:AraC family transcriptional regulator, regulatory protein of adaptative response / DNA-3-methyladenine glycosylase II